MQGRYPNQAEEGYRGKVKEDTIDEGANRRAQYKQHGPDKNKDDVRRLGSETQEMNETGERNRSEGGKDFKNEKYQSLEN